MDDVSTGTKRRGQRVGEDVIVTLYRPAELLSVDPEAMLERDARIEPGADEIVHELLGRSRVQRQARIVVMLPRRADHRWCCRETARSAPTLLRGAAGTGSARD